MTAVVSNVDLRMVISSFCKQSTGEDILGGH